MRLAILVSFLSLWIFSIVAPSIIAIVEEGAESVWVFYHTEEEQQESGEKDKFEEKILPEYFHRLLTAYASVNHVPMNKIIYLNSSHIQEIFLPPPERII